MGKPSDTEDYDVVTDNDINVYIRVDVQAQDAGLSISTAKLLFKENLIVDGLVY